jgi:hypothetical protein
LGPHQGLVARLRLVCQAGLGSGLVVLVGLGGARWPSERARRKRAGEGEGPVPVPVPDPSELVLVNRRSPSQDSGPIKEEAARPPGSVPPHRIEGGRAAPLATAANDIAQAMRPPRHPELTPYGPSAAPLHHVLVPPSLDLPVLEPPPPNREASARDEEGSGPLPPASRTVAQDLPTHPHRSLCHAAHCRCW